jgi:Exocyst complex component Sec6
MRTESRRYSHRTSAMDGPGPGPSFDPFERRKLSAVSPDGGEVFDAFDLVGKPITDYDALMYNVGNDFSEAKCCVPTQFLRSRSAGRKRFGRTAEARQRRSSSRGRRRNRGADFRQVKFDEFVKVETYDDDDDDGDGEPGNDNDGEARDVLTGLPNQQLTLSTRLPPLDDIPTAVQTLEIDDYPEAAEHRATQIIKHWILDKGLFDELANLSYMNSSLLNESFDELVSVPSTKSQEGVEVGAHGYPMEGLQRLDLEMGILGERMRRELAVVNAQLNLTTTDQDGDLGEKEFATFLAEFEEHPRLQSLLTGRDNIHNVFEQVDTFCTIPEICDRLYQEMSDEPLALRDLCKQHNQLQLMLVEIEADLKDRMDDVAIAVSNGGRRGSSSHLHSHCFVPSYPNHGGVDDFLSKPSKLVWDLGYRLHHRLMERIKGIHRLRPHEIEALTESVELYEQTSKEQTRGRPNHANKKRAARLRLEPLRQVALYTLVEAFENRCYQVIQALQEQAADDAQSQDGEQIQFNAIHEAATMLLDQVESIQSLVEPYVPVSWHVTALWMLCVATVSSQFILQQIGGQEGNNLEFMTVTQLLDLLSWIEHFRNKADEIFPEMLRDVITKTRFVCIAELLDDRDITDATVKECLVSVLHVLWDIHRLTHDQFMVRTQFQTHAWLENVYKADHQKAQITDGRLITSLPEDVWALARVQLETIAERLPDESAVLVDAASMVFYQMQLKQRRARDSFLVDLETCCAAANDLIRMSEQAEQSLTIFRESSGLSMESMATLETITDELIRQYSNDAVFSAQAVHAFIFDTLEDELAGKMFEFEWEDKTYNEMAMTIVRTIEDFLVDVELWMDPTMARKAIDGMVKGCVNFYIRHLMLKASKRSKLALTSCFQSNERAMQRMAGDIKVMRDFFEGLVESFPPLGRIIEMEFALLENIFGLLAIASDLDEEAAAEDFIPVVHKHVRDVDLTGFLCAGLWKLVNPAQVGVVQFILEENREGWAAYGAKDDPISQEHVDPTLQLSFTLLGVVDEIKRGGPKAKLKAKAVEKMKKMKDVMQTLRKGKHHKGDEGQEI